MSTSSSESPRGFAAAIGAYLIWGLVLPLYLKTLAHLPAAEVLAHRIAWSLPFAAILLAWFGRFSEIRPFLNARMLSRAALCATVITINWGVYIYAISIGHLVDAALGYYINPLVSLALGAAFLGERPTRAQGFAIALACLGVLVLTVATGGLPWISLTLACSFGTYGLLRKMLPFGATQGFFLEVAILFPFALALIAWSAWSGHIAFLDSGRDAALLVMAGPLTAIPLILFATGARLLKLSTIGILQYMVPTLLFLTAVFVFGEPFGIWQLVAFAFIWSALAIYTGSLLQESRARRAVVTSAR